MKKSRKLAPSKYLRKYGKAKISRPMITKEEVEAVLECVITDERYEELLEASRLYSLSNSDKHVNLAQDAEHNQDWEGAKKHWKNAALASIKHDTIHKTQRSDKLKVRGITMRKEEVEQIDELRKRTAFNYLDRSSWENKEGQSETKKKARSKGFKRAAEKLGYKNESKPVKEEVEQINELSNDTLRSYERKATGTAQQFFAAHDRGARAARLTPPPSDHSTTKRLKGRLTALSKLHARNEEVEQIDELSSPLLKRYVPASKKSEEYHDLHMDHHSKKGRSHKAFAKHLHKGTSRTIGRSRAKLLLKKRRESVDEAVELSSSRKTKVNALLAKHQAKGLPAKPSKKYTREYTGDGLPLIAAVINQEETLNETKE